jgi:hypothetical protein
MLSKEHDFVHLATGKMALKPFPPSMPARTHEPQKGSGLSLPAAFAFRPANEGALIDWRCFALMLPLNAHD